MDTNDIWVAPKEGLNADRKFLTEMLASYECEWVNDDGEISDKNYTALYEEINFTFGDYLRDCYEKVNEQMERNERNMEAHKSPSHFRIYHRNKDVENMRDWSLSCCFNTLDDAKDEIRDWIKGPEDEYKILEVKDGIEGTEDFYK
jgi:hypothetical protein